MVPPRSRPVPDDHELGNSTQFPQVPHKKDDTYTMRATRTTIYGADSQRMLDWATNSLQHFLEFPTEHTLSEVRNYIDTIEETMNPATPQDGES